MNAKKLFLSLRWALPAALLALILVAGLAAAEAPQPEGSVTTAFTYQGRLTDAGGALVNKTCDFHFSLWDALTGPTQVGSTLDKTGVQVIDGLFTVPLDFGDVWLGTALWLEVAVKCSGDSDYAALSPRQELTAAPNALYAMLAEEANQAAVAVSAANADQVDSYHAGNAAGQVPLSNGTVNTNLNADLLDGLHEGAFFRLGQNEVVTGIPRFAGGTMGSTPPFTVTSSFLVAFLNADQLDGLHEGAFFRLGQDEMVAGSPTFNGTPPFHVVDTGKINNLNADLLDGQHSAAFSLPGHNHWGETWSGTGTGLSLQGGTTGLSGSGTAYGVYGEGTSYGVYGTTSHNTGYGVSGYASDTSGVNAGVYGKSDSTAGYGVFGEATATSGATGVYGKSAGIAGAGVYGQSVGTSGAGVYGGADSATGTTYGVYAYSASAAGYGVYGKGYVGGKFVGNGGDILQGWDGSSQRFKVTNNGSVYTDGGYYCGRSIVCTGAGGTCTEADLETGPCLQDDTAADFAEMLPAARALEPGDLLVVGLDGKLTLSSQPYQPSVVGVYSTRPSYVGNSRYWGQSGYAPLALTGVVPVKASAENGPIRPGDLLTASSIPGHAMRCEGMDKCFGRTVGKALAGLDSGTGVILMLVMLQ